MRRRKDARPILESMAPRRLLSAQGAVTPTAMFEPIPPTFHGNITTLPLALNGSVRGQFSEGTSNPDAGKAITLSGAGTLGAMGKVHVSGHFGTPGFIASGHAGGTLELSNARGTVTLQIEGPTQPGFSAAPSRFTYIVTGGAGVYSHSGGSGRLTLDLAAGHSGGPISLHHLGSGNVSIHFG